MRMSDWSSDVCSSDLGPPRRFEPPACGRVTNAAKAAVVSGPAAGLWRVFHCPPLATGSRKSAQPLCLVPLPLKRSDPDRKSGREGKSVYVRVDLGGRRLLKKTTNNHRTNTNTN